MSALCPSTTVAYRREASQTTAVNPHSCATDVPQQALLSVGVVKIGLVAEGTAESESYLQDADQPCVEPYGRS